MFGNTGTGGFGGFGTQQPPQTPFGGNTGGVFGAPAPAQNAFGQPAAQSAFGAPAAAPAVNPFGAPAAPAAGGFGGLGAAKPFGATNAFGAPAAPAAPAFGGGATAGGFGAPAAGAFGQPAQQPTTGGFMGFGTQQQQQAPAQQAPFGTTSGGFGTTSAFGAAPQNPPSPFGGQQQQSAFGAPQQQQQGFGGGAFGAPTSAFGAPQQVPVGTGQIPFAAKETVDNGTDPKTRRPTSSRSIHQTLSMMDEYRMKSPEELRWEDYQNNLKTKQQAGGFGAPTSPFGGQAFGSQPQQPQQTGAFGAPAASTSFGAPATSAFGAPAQQSNPFGAPQQPAQGAFGGSAFGQPQQTGAFGAPAAATPFGQQPSQPQQSTGFGVFGQQQAGAPPSPFGAKPATTTGGFGGFGTAAPSVGGFGQPQQQPQQPQQGGGLFGQQQPQQQPPPAQGGLFGGFGAGQQQQQPQQQQQQQQPAGSQFMFGGGNTTQQAGGASPFGGAGGFGAKPATGGLFGGSATGGAAAPAAGGGLFGQQTQGAPATGGLFGGSTGGTLGGFGQSGGQAGQTQAKPAFGGFGGFGTQTGGLTGTAPTTGGGLFGGGGTGGGGLFGGGGQSTGGGFGSLFNAGANQAQQSQPQAPPQPAGVATTPFGTLPAAPAAPSELPEAPTFAKGLTVRAGKALGATRPQVVYATRTITPRAHAARPLDGLATAGRRSLAVGGLAEDLAPGGLVRTGSRGGLSIDAPKSYEPSFKSESAAVKAADAFVASTTGNGNGNGNGSGNGNGNGAGPSSGVATPVLDRPEAERRRLNYPSAVRPTADRLEKNPEALVPRLTLPQYSTIPSIAELRARARNEPESLARVQDFTIKAQDLGEVMFPGETDVRGLDLDAIVDFHSEPGNLKMYLGEAVTKPPVGRGLNKRARVRLLNIRKRKPTESDEKIERRREQIRAATENFGGTFLSWEPAEGVWSFVVEHFSRYGIADLSDDDDDSAIQVDPVPAVGTASEGTEGAALFLTAPPRALLPPVEEDGPEISLVPSERSDPGIVVTSGHVGVATVAPTPPTALRPPHPADPEAVFFRREGHESRLTAQAPPPSAPLASLLGVFSAGAPFAHPTPSAPVTPGQGRIDMPEPPALPLGAPRRALYGAPAGPAKNNWRPRPPPSIAPEPAAAPSTGHAPAPAARQRTCLVTSVPRALFLPAGGSMVDAGALLGRSFRVGFGPGFLFAHGQVVGNDTASPMSAGCIRIRRLVPDSIHDGEERGRWSSLLHTQLTIHRRHSERTPSGRLESEPDAFPAFRLQSDREGVLKRLVEEGFLAPLRRAAEGAPATTRLVLEHQAELWNVLLALFRKIPGEGDRDLRLGTHAASRAAAGRITLDDDDGGGGGDDARMGEEQGEEGAAAAASGGRPPLDPLVANRSVLAQAQRRAGLSQLWRARTRGATEADLQSGAYPGRLVLRMAGHQLTEAVREAMGARDFRLSALLSAAGLSSQAQADVASQLAVWARERFQDKIDPARWVAFMLLAGQVTAALEASKRTAPELLAALDWRRQFGLFLWYGPRAQWDLASTLDLYYDAVVSGAAKAPVPLYAEALDPDRPGTGYDATFELLRLATGHGPATDPDTFTARLLRPGGYSPDPLDFSASWALAQVLGAIGRLPAAAATGWELYSVCVGLVGQLQALGGERVADAVYVASTLPDHPLLPGLRDRLIADLLHRACPVWSKSDALQKELQALGVRGDQLAAAKAQLIRAAGAELKSAELDAALDARDYARAHVLLATTAGPECVTRGDLGRLRQLVDRFTREAAPLPAGWHVGGELLQTYVALREGGGSSEPDEARAAEMRTRLVEAQARWSKELRAVRAGPAVERLLVQSHAAMARAAVDLATGVGAAARAAPAALWAQLASSSELLPPDERLKLLHRAAARLLQ